MENYYWLKLIKPTNYKNVNLSLKEVQIIHFNMCNGVHFYIPTLITNM